MVKYEHHFDDSTGMPLRDKKGKIKITKVDKKRGSLDEPTVIKDGPLRIFRKKGK